MDEESNATQGREQNIMGLKRLLKQVEEFDINEAHCFDPNEEYKLRKLMYDIGTNRLDAIKNEVYKMVKEKLNLPHKPNKVVPS